MSDWADFCSLQGLDPMDHDAIDQFYENESRADELATVKSNPHGVALKTFLRRHADKGCERCSGTGYLSQWKKVEAGRCFLCFPDSRWKELGFT